MHVINTIVHDGCSYIFPSKSLCPSRQDIQVQSWLPTILSYIFLYHIDTYCHVFGILQIIISTHQIPLMFKIWICWFIRNRNVFCPYDKSCVTPLRPLKSRLLNSAFNLLLLNGFSKLILHQIIFIHVIYTVATHWMWLRCTNLWMGLK